MKNIFQTLLFLIITYEFLKYFKFHQLFKNFISEINSLVNMFKSNNVDDDFKQKEIIKFSKKIFALTLKTIIVLIILSLFLAVNYLINSSFLKFLVSFKGIFLSIIILFIYNYLKRKIYEKV